MLKKPTSLDWHAADISAAVKKSGTSLQRLSRLNGFCSGSLAQALYRPYPKCERIIAEHLGLAVQTIWPSRYNADGTPKSGRGERGIGRHQSNLVKTTKRSIYALKTIKPKTVKPKCSTKPKIINVNNERPIKQELAA